MQKILIYLAVSLLAWQTTGLQAKQRLSTLKEDTRQVREWNRFAESIYLLHKWLISQHPIRTEESSGGYRRGGYLGGPDFYREVKYINAENGRLLSKIQWEKENPDTIHTIEVYFYDDDGEARLDYLAAYLPAFRNAPVQTLINLHAHNDDLHAFRQFDASGDRIYEQCSGEHFSGTVDISLEDYSLLAPSDETARLLASEAYIACFGSLPLTVGKYLDPLNNIPGSANNTQAIDDKTSRYAADQILMLNKQIKQHPNKADLYLQRGKLNVRIRELDDAVADTSKALELDKTQVEAWLWRGVAFGRQRKLDAAIDDLGIYLEHRPNDSHAYTKRGVRYIWKGDLVSAEKDLRRAIHLDATNAEAHDDLGVIVAQRGELKEAGQHFSTTVSIDPSYAKGYQNLAMTYFLQGEFVPALQAVNRSLALHAENRSSLLLKAEVLVALGRNDEAAQLKTRAAFLPEAGWSERFHVGP
ncbi:tetratricopeptide repeat protein [Sulfuriflexus sp.]|uniref:tetratricopeptide repeat protein n=1 Tax=Sulfuriflexus sp. TaxID=2015443 RepID=UPI0028CE3B43|nr:tetratricopeptide repeat protein [Sulfuriflexus sp.]MDT8404918.1 tetratricopeptide repeat protein [Sulfuriflexus sp.]